MAKTREYMDYLDENIEIAPANSQEEYQAAEIIADVMADHGIEPAIEEFDAYPMGEMMVPLLCLVAFICLVVTGVTEGVAHIIALILAAAAAGLVIFVHFGGNLFETFGPASRSQNVVGVHRASGDKVVKGARPIVIVAHYDTARERLLKKTPLAKHESTLRRATIPCMIVVAVTLLFQLLVFLPSLVRMFVWVVGILAAIPLALLSVVAFVDRRASCTLGANDNKASVAALLAILDKVRPGDDRVSGEDADERPQRRRATDEPPAPRLIEVVEEVKGVRHGAAVLESLGMLPPTCEIVYEEPKVHVVEEAPDTEYAKATPAEALEPEDFEEAATTYLEDEEAFVDDWAGKPEEDAVDEGDSEPEEEPQQVSDSSDDTEEPHAVSAYDDEQDGSDYEEADEYELEDEYEAEGLDEDLEGEFEEYLEDDYDEFDEEEIDYDEFEDDGEVDESPFTFAAVGEWFSQRFAGLREYFSPNKGEDVQIERGADRRGTEDDVESDEVYGDYDEFDDDEFNGWIDDYDEQEDEQEDEPPAEVDGEYEEEESFEEDFPQEDDSDLDGSSLAWDAEDESPDDEAYEDYDFDAYAYDEEDEPTDADESEQPQAFGGARDFEYDESEQDEDAEDDWVDEWIEEEDYDDEEEEAVDDAPPFVERVKAFFRKMSAIPEDFDEDVPDDAEDVYDFEVDEEDDLVGEDEEETLEEEFLDESDYDDDAYDEGYEYEDEDSEYEEDEYFDAEAVEDDYEDDEYAEYDDEEYADYAYEDEEDEDETVPTEPRLGSDSVPDLQEDPDSLHLDYEEDADILPRDTTGLDTLSDSYDMYETEADSGSTHERPEPIDDPNWGVSSFQPARPVMNIARRAALFDLPDPSAATVDPLEEEDEYEDDLYEEDVTYEEAEELEGEEQPYDDDETSDTSQGGFWGDESGAGTAGWKGGATLRADLRATNDDEPLVIDEEDLQEAILELGDEFLIAHDIWFVATGASKVGHAGIKAFLDEHRRDIRGAFLVNLETIGAGDLAVITREGYRAPRRADRRLVRMLRDVAEDLHIDLETATMEWDELESATGMRSRVRSVSVVGLDENDMPALSGTADDVPDNVLPKQVSSVVRMVTELIRRS